jgi:hypothetical protein
MFELGLAAGKVEAATGGWHILNPKRGVPLDKNEGVVKRHFCSAMPSSNARISEWWRTEASETRTVNQLSADRSANHRYGDDFCG